MTTQKETQLTLMSWLPNTAGWTALSQTKREWLQKRTSNIADFRQMQKAGVIGEMRELFLIQEGLKGEKMTMEAYLAAGYGKSSRTGWRRLNGYGKLLGVMSDKAIEAIATDSGNVMQGSEGLEAAVLIRIAKDVPALKSDDPKVIEGGMVTLRDKLKLERRQRHKIPKPTEEDALLTFVQTGVKLLDDIGFNDTRSQKKFLEVGNGYIMQERAIAGSLEAKRLPIPDDFFPKRGAPRKYPKGEKP